MLFMLKNKLPVPIGTRKQAGRRKVYTVDELVEKIGWRSETLINIHRTFPTNDAAEHLPRSKVFTGWELSRNRDNAAAGRKGSMQEMPWRLAAFRLRNNRMAREVAAWLAFYIQLEELEQSLTFTQAAERWGKSIDFADENAPAFSKVQEAMQAAVKETWEYVEVLVQVDALERIKGAGRHERRLAKRRPARRRRAK